MSDKEYQVRVQARDRSEKILHMIEGFFGNSRGLCRGRGDAWEPPMDVYETRDAVIMRMSLPGVDAGDIRIAYDGDVITISGHREAEPEPDLVAYHRMEIRNGYFERRVVIQNPINPEKAEAEYRDGFLKIRLPKTSDERRRTYKLKIQL